MASWRNGSKKQYSAFITKWQNVCKQRQVNYIQPSFACPWLPYNTIRSRPHIHCHQHCQKCLVQLYYIRGWEMCRKTRIIVQADEKHLPGKTSNTDVHGNLRCVYCSFIPSIPTPRGYIAAEGTYAGTCCVDFISIEPKRSDRISGNIDRMVFANNYIFQLVEHLEQNRPVVKNPLVKLKAFDDKTLCVVTTLKEYPTRTHWFWFRNKHFKI